MIKLGDVVEVVKQKQKSKKWKKYYGFDLIGKKGKVVAFLGTQKEPHQGVKVRFPCIWINSGNSKKPVYGFEWAFYSDEIKRVNEKIEFRQPPKKTALRGKALERRKKIVRELREKGESIENLAKRFNVSKRTIWYWLK